MNIVNADALWFVAYVIAVALLTGCFAYVVGFKHGRDREKLEPVQNGRIHLNDGRIIAGRIGTSPEQAIAQLIEASADLCAERRAVRIWKAVFADVKGQPSKTSNKKEAA